MPKRVNMMLDDEAAALLRTLAGSTHKQGAYVSRLIRAAASAQEPEHLREGDRALAELGRQVLHLVDEAEHSLSYRTALASEAALARLWDTPAEDAAWQHL